MKLACYYLAMRDGGVYVYKHGPFQSWNDANDFKTKLDDVLKGYYDVVRVEMDVFQ